MSTTETKAKAPSYFAYQVREGDKQSYWTRIGAAWPNKDGKGFSIQLDALPLDGRINLRLTSEQQ